MFLEPPTNFYRITVSGVAGADTLRRQLSHPSGVEPVSQPRFALSVAHTGTFTTPLDTPFAAAYPNRNVVDRHWGLVPTTTPLDAEEPLLQTTVATPSAASSSAAPPAVAGLHDVGGRLHVELWQLPSAAQVAEKLTSVSAFSSTATVPMRSVAVATDDASYVAALLRLGAQSARASTVAGGAVTDPRMVSFRAVMNSMVELQSAILVADGQFSLSDIAQRGGAQQEGRAAPQQTLPLQLRIAPIMLVSFGTEAGNLTQVGIIGSVTQVDNLVHPLVASRLAPTPLMMSRDRAVAAVAPGSPGAFYGQQRGMGGAMEPLPPVPILSAGIASVVDDDASLAQMREWQQHTAAGIGSSTPIPAARGVPLPYLSGGLLLGCAWAALAVEAQTNAAMCFGPSATAALNLTSLLTVPNGIGGAASGSYDMPPVLSMGDRICVAVQRTAEGAAAQSAALAGMYERRREQLGHQFDMEQQQRSTLTPQHHSITPMKIVNAYGEEIGSSLSDSISTQRDERQMYVDANCGPRPVPVSAGTVAATVFTVYDICKWMTRMDLSTQNDDKGARFRVTHNANDGSVTVHVPLVATSCDSLHVLVLHIHSLPWFLHLVRGGACPLEASAALNPMAAALARQQQSTQHYHEQRQLYGGASMVSTPTAFHTPSSSTSGFVYRILSTTLIAMIFRAKLRIAMARYALQLPHRSRLTHFGGPIPSVGDVSSLVLHHDVLRARKSHLVSIIASNRGRTQSVFGGVNAQAFPFVPSGGTFLTSPSPPVGAFGGLSPSATVGAFATFTTSDADLAVMQMASMLPAELVTTLLRLQHSDAAAGAAATTSAKQPLGAKFVLWSYTRAVKVLSLTRSIAVDFPAYALNWENPVFSATLLSLYVVLCVAPELVFPLAVIAALYLLLVHSVDFGKPLWLKAVSDSARMTEDPLQVKRESGLGGEAPRGSRLLKAIRAVISVPDGEDDDDGDLAQATVSTDRIGSISPRGAPLYSTPGGRLDAGYRTFASRSFSPQLALFDDSASVYQSITAARSVATASGETAAAAATRAELQRQTEALISALNSVVDAVERVQGLIMWRAPVITGLVCAELAALLVVLLLSPAAWMTALLIGLAVGIPISPVRYILNATLRLIFTSPALVSARFISVE